MTRLAILPLSPTFVSVWDPFFRSAMWGWGLRSKVTPIVRLPFVAGCPLVGEGTLARPGDRSVIDLVARPAPADWSAYLGGRVAIVALEA